MAYAFLTPENVFKLYDESKRHTETLTRPFPEFQRIARNRPHEGIDPAYPKTTDGTSASIVQKTPKRVVQQLPTGKIIAEDDDDYVGIIAEFIFTNKILPHANEDYGLFEKSHLVIENGLTLGATCTYAPFLKHDDGYMCPDLTVPYWGDISYQKGKKSGYSCNYVFLRSWWNREDLEALVKRETSRAEKAAERGEQYDSTWDVEAVKEILDKESAKDEQAKTPNESDRGVATSAIELVTGFQKGVKAKFYTFEPSAKRIVRTKQNKDPRGKIPLDWFYGDIDGENPLGRGVIELIGGLQNLIDSDMQMYQYNRALMLAPPVVKYGNLGDFKFAPNFVVEALDPNAKIVPLTVDSTAIANYPQLYGLQKSQLLNLVNSPDTSISSDVGNPGFGKTPEALKSQKAVISVDDNAVRKRFESWFESWAENVINIYFAERTGVELLQLDDATADRLRKLAEKGKFDINTLNENNQILINYDEATPALKFRVDASTSKMKDDSDQLQAKIGLLEQLKNNPLLQQIVPPIKIAATWNSIVASSGIEDPELLTIDLKEMEEKIAQAEEAAAQQAQAQKQPEQQMLPAETMQQMPQDMMQEVDPDTQLLQDLTALNVNPQVIMWAKEQMDSGVSPDVVTQALTVAGGQQ